jgi:hypothetical protein
MPVSTNLPVMAGLAIVGAALGITLGREAVAEINPAYFNEAEDDFHADLVPQSGTGWAQVQPVDYRAVQQPVMIGALGTGCVGCSTYPVEYRPKHDPAVDGYYEGGLLRAPEPTNAVALVETDPAPAPDPALERIQAYSSYPVSHEERPVEVAEVPVEEIAEPTGL